MSATPAQAPSTGGEALPAAPLDVAPLLVEQNATFVKKLGDRVAVMDDGRIVHAGSMREFAADQALQERLLGLAMEVHS